MYLKNFRRYWKEQLTHAAVGLAAGCLLVSGYPAAGGGILALVIARQSFGVPAILGDHGTRRKIQALDLAYHLGCGCIVGIGCGVVWLT